MTTTREDGKLLVALNGLIERNQGNTSTLDFFTGQVANCCSGLRETDNQAKIA
jgi:hypothetical protein